MAQSISQLISCFAILVAGITPIIHKVVGNYSGQHAQTSNSWGQFSLIARKTWFFR
jgi:hypothetical protein